jgi:nucleotide-binding universal stress UspA family protein
MEKVLVGLDEEAASQTAVDWVIDRARRTPLHVTLYTAFDMIVSDVVADGELLRSTAARITDTAPGTVVETIAEDRSILEGLIERSGDADLVVIGSHPHRRVRSILTGSLPTAVVTRAHCPTVVVPDDWEPGGTRVVLGVADDASSDAATSFAAREALSAGVPLDAVHAWRLPVPSMDAVASLVIDAEGLEAIHNELVERVTERLDQDYEGLEVRGILNHGDSAATLDDQIEGARLVVLGTHRHGPAVGALMGSTVQHLLHHGRVAMAIVPMVSPEEHARAHRDAERA